MKQQEMKAIIDKYIQAYNSFDIDSMLALMHDEVEFKNISGGNINMTTKGINDFRSAAEQAKNLFVTRCQKVAENEFENDTATIAIDYEGVLRADIPGGPKAGERLILKGRSVFEFKDDKIVSLCDYSQESQRTIASTIF
ncbi:MAG: nuclear transport factor 2 family protein [Anaerolineaceae bacterium]|nr:nuclear transport factor 2 family protein [Anaerolineaceae bacterium]